MKVIRQFEPLPLDGQPVFCAIGMFDGVHQGHQLLLKHVKEQAAKHQGISVVLTFQEHPTHILSPDHTPLMIYPSAIKEGLFADLGLDMAWIIPFDTYLSRLKAEEFIRSIKQFCGNLAGICVGRNFGFGHQRKGNVNLLTQLGNQWGFEAEGKAPVTCDGDSISSTRIRKLILEGDLREASKLLGRTYCLTSHVIKGDGLGSKLGFPTANLDCRQLATPPSGVYAVLWEDDQQKTHPGVLNIGYRPTLNTPDPKLQIEVHFWGMERDLYGKTLTLEICKKLREEQKFPNVDALTHQIRSDILSASHYFDTRRHSGTDH